MNITQLAWFLAYNKKIKDEFQMKFKTNKTRRCNKKKVMCEVTEGNWDVVADDDDEDN